MQKVPYMLILGDKELEDGAVAVRERKQGDIGTMSLAEFTEAIARKREARSL
jgi:threonyl-tRNA synthetase